MLALLVQRDTLASYTLSAFGAVALGSILLDALRSEKVERERLFVVLILMFFSMLFWAFFEQAGSSISNFTDRNVDRVVESRALAADEVGKTVEVQLSQELVGRTKDGKLFTLDQLDAAPALRESSRLACQCVPDGTSDVHVRLPAWKRNEVSEEPH